MTLIEIFSIIIIHWIADFIFQDEKWAINKSKNWSSLLNHTYTYTGIWFIFISWLIVGGFKTTPLSFLLFLIITFVAHTITDYFTSRIVSRKFERKEYGSPIPNLGAFTIIGFDQVLHYIQLFLTYYILIR